MVFAPITIAPHPLLDLHAFLATLPSVTGSIAAIPDLAEVPSVEGDSVRAAVRDLLRHGGFRPSGRNKPASEYLAANPLPSINLAVDLGNAVSRRSGLPISVVDADLLRPPLRVAIAEPGTTYPFNPAGQIFDAGGLVCLLDADGVSATAVKDAQRTKTSTTTTRVLCLVWGVAAHAAHGRAVADGYRRAMTAVGASITDVDVT